MVAGAALMVSMTTPLGARAMEEPPKPTPQIPAGSPPTKECNPPTCIATTGKRPPPDPSPPVNVFRPGGPRDQIPNAERVDKGSKDKATPDANNNSDNTDPKNPTTCTPVTLATGEKLLD